MSLSYLQLNYDTYVSERNKFIKENENRALAQGDMSYANSFDFINQESKRKAA